MKNKSSPHVLRARPAKGGTSREDFARTLIFSRLLVTGYWLLFTGFLLLSCAHSIIEAREQHMASVSRTYKADANQVYLALTWAFKTGGYPIESEDRDAGVVRTTWLPTGADSHYRDTFGRRDYGVNGGYHYLEARIVPENGDTKLVILSHVKSVVAHLKSSGIEEKKVMNKVADYLRKEEVRVTNLGLEE